MKILLTQIVVTGACLFLMTTYKEATYPKTYRFFGILGSISLIAIPVTLILMIWGII